MNGRLAIVNNSVTQQKSPVILYLRHVRESDDVQKEFIIKNDSNIISDQSDQEPDESNLQDAEIAYFENKEGESNLIWSHKKPSEHDHQATEYFLQIRSLDKYKEFFADKKYGKYKLWTEIANDMNNAGYYVGEGRDGAERCRQKFCNLEKSFLNYIKHIRSGGSTRKEPPLFYEYMVNLVDTENRLKEQNQNAIIDAVRDSLQIDLVTATSKDNILPLPSHSSTKINDNNINKTQTDMSNNFQTEQQQQERQNNSKSKYKNELISLLRNQHAEIMNLQREFLEKIDKHLTVQNEQRERMINSFIEVMNSDTTSCNNCNRKRKRKSSTATDLEHHANNTS